MIIICSPGYRKDFRKLPRKIQDKADERIALLVRDESDPILKSHKLNPPYSGHRSISVTGDIRVVYRKIGREGFCLVAIGTHSQLYE